MSLRSIELDFCNFNNYVQLFDQWPPPPPEQRSRRSFAAISTTATPSVSLSDGLFREIQSIQNAAARLVTGTRQCDHITPVLRQLHWLPVRRRVDYKVACLVHQSLVGQTPAYLAEAIRLVTHTDRRPLHQPLSGHASHNSFGDRSFSAAGPRVWSSFPPHLRQDMNFARFQHKLETFMFGS